MFAERETLIRFFRLLLPAWKFFDQAGHTPILQFRLEAPGSVGKWENVLVFSRRSRLPLVNAKGNLILYKQGIVQKFTQHLSEISNYKDSEFFPLIKRMAQQKIFQNDPLLLSKGKDGPKFFRLRVIENDTFTNQATIGLFFESNEIPVEGL